MQLRAVIVEDERKGLINLTQMLSLHCGEQVEVVGDADGVETGVALLSRPDLKPDLAFLDINLADGKVFQLLERIKPIDFDIVFVTAYDQFAIRACDYASIGYILKPIDPDELIRSVSRVMDRRRARTEERLEILRQYQNHPNTFDRMSFPGVDDVKFAEISDIMRFEAEDNYTHVFLKGGRRITVSRTIKHYEDLLTPFNFYRVHKRHIVNLNYMNKFVKGEGGYLVMDDGVRIEVSRRRRSAFMSQLRML